MPVTGGEPVAAARAAVFSNWRHFLAFGFGSGLARFAPGTFGTIVAIPIYLLIKELPPVQYGICVLGTFVFGVWLCSTVSRDIGVHDHGGIVWDEFVGYWTTMFLVPAGWGSVLAGFALFRLFDIWKPWPIRWVDRKVGGGLGIMLDDVAAGVVCCLILHAILRMGLL